MRKEEGRLLSWVDRGRSEGKKKGREQRNKGLNERTVIPINSAKHDTLIFIDHDVPKTVFLPATQEGGYLSAHL